MRWPRLRHCLERRGQPAPSTGRVHFALCLWRPHWAWPFHRCCRARLASGAVAGVALLMVPVLTLASVFAYERGSARQPASTSAGTHIGALLGLLMGAWIAFVTGVAGFVLRYGYHSRAMDDTIGQALNQMPAQLTAQMASVGPPPPELLAFIASPEFRAGSFIFGHVFWLLLLVAAGSVCGWMSAAILRTRRPPDAG